MSAKILCEAIAFGFGPVGKLLAIAHELVKDFELDFIGSGSSLELAKRTNYFLNIIELDTTSVNSRIPREIIDNYDTIISVINPIFAEQVLNYGKKLIVIDSLFYMWHEIPSVWKECDLLIVQSFNNEKKRLANELFKNAKVVGPIISHSINSTSQEGNDSIVINFGGADYPYTTDDSIIPEFIKSLISKLTIVSHYRERIISIGPRQLKKIKYLEKDGYIINTYSHNEFLNLVKKAKLILTVPGLTTMYETFGNSIPTIFLPPMNYSQFLNLRKLKENDVARYSVNWDSIYNTSSTILDEDHGVQMVESFLSKSLSDNKIQEVFKSNIEQYLIFQDNKILAKNQNDFFLKNGGIGTYRTVELIKDIVYGQSLGNCKKQ